MRRERFLAGALSVALVLLNGCGNSVPEAKKEAAQRWGRTRAQVTAEVAEELLRVGKIDEAEAKANEALSSDVHCMPAQLTLARVYIEQGRYQSAAAMLVRLATEGEESADQAYLLGVALEKQGQPAEALASYYRAQALTTTGHAPILAAAEVLVSMGRPDKARQAIERHLNNAKGDVAMVELAARLSMMLKDYPRATELYRQACDLDAENPGYRMGLVRAEWLAGQYEDALTTLDALSRTRKYAASAWVYAMKGDCAMELHRAWDARGAYREATRLEPYTAGLWVKLARADLAAEMPAEAVRSATQALTLDPQSLDASMVLGYALLRNGESARAVAAMTETVGAHPGSATAWCLLGRAHQAAGDPRKALGSYQKARDIEPGNAVVKELIASVGSK
jgi:predicted Zn-dependent protease